MNWKTAFVFLAITVSCVRGGDQTPPAAILEIDIDNTVSYIDDLTDPQKKATSATATPVAPGFIYPFKPNLVLGDIVAVNGKPAKGLFVQHWGPRVLGTPDFTPGRAIADLGGGCPLEAAFMILQEDGKAVGNIMMIGTSSGPPPGAPAGSTNFNYAVVGGNGAFLGVRGQSSRMSAIGVRLASMIEDPAYRRINGGGKWRFAVQLIPMGRPEVISTATGAAVTHLDGKLVSNANPAQAGETLTLYATGLGPTTPAVDLGQPFTKDKVHKVMAPVDVVVDGKAVEVLYAGGYPDAVDVYQVNFKLPDLLNPATPALRTIGLRLTAAWIPGPEVKIATK
jgi:hypothetical protein